MSIKYEVYYEFFEGEYETPKLSILLHSTKSQQKLKHYLELFLTNNKGKCGRLMYGIKETSEKLANIAKNNGQSCLRLKEISDIYSLFGTHCIHYLSIHSS